MAMPLNEEDEAKAALSSAKSLEKEGKFEEALEKHIWFHHHALESRPSYYGVRLSFALSYWIELGNKYPKALAALKDIRDEKTARLLKGETDRELFHDVEAINGYLNESRATVDLFKKLDGTGGVFAATVSDLVEPVLIEAGEFDLTKKYLGDPLKQFLDAKQQFEEGMEYSKSSQCPEANRSAIEGIFSDKVVGIILILHNTGDSELAGEIRSQALCVLDSTLIRDAITR